MYVGIIYVAICSGWLCRAVHGEESAIPTNHRFETFDECIAVNELSAELVIGTNLHWRVECKKEPL